MGQRSVTSYQEVAMGKPRGLGTARKHVCRSPLRSLWICWSPIRWILCLWCLPICLRSLPICLWSLLRILRICQTLLLRICPICLWSLPIRLWICLGKVNYFSRKYQVIANQKLNSNFSFSFHYWIGFIVVNEFDIKNKIKTLKKKKKKKKKKVLCVD